MLLKRAFVFACLLALAPRTASAVQYEIFIDIEAEEDLYDLLVTEQISESSFDALLLLYQTRVELNRANRSRLYLLPNLDYKHVDRILAYRKETGVIHSLGDLIAGGVLEAEVAGSLRPFVIVRVPDAPRSQTSGFVRVQGRWSGRYDRLPPASAVQARIKTLRHLDMGLAGALTRNRLRRVRWDQSRGGLVAEAEHVRFEVPKLYVEWEDDKWEIIGGTYRIGFGQRLTFDVTDQVTPNGFFGDYELRRNNELGLRCRRAAGELAASPCPSDRITRVTPDYAWTNRLAGVAMGLKDLSVGQGWLQLYAWGSYQVHRIPQIEVVDARTCSDPRRDDDPACRAPPVYIPTGGPSAPASTATFATLPAMYAEGLAGANVSYFWHDRAHIGLTGYRSVPRWLIPGAELGFQEFSRKPFGGAFGAVGADAAFGFGVQDFFAEVARSFDAEVGGGGGYGVIVRSVTTLPATEVDVSVRYYGSRYVNPYARPVSAPDELDGLRARDEAGFRLRTTTRLGPRVGLRTIADGWHQLSSGSFNGLLFARADLQIAASWVWSVWTEYRNSTAQRVLLATRLAYEPVHRLTLSGQFQHRSVGARAGGVRLQQDVAAILTVTTRPVDVLRIRLRVRYDFEDISDNHRLPQALWAYLDAALTLRQRDMLRLRYDFRVFLDRRESTFARVPNPEHWLWVEYVFRY
ncbi:MAG: hypothetical protein DRH30_01725 [Deltaproteobacteria bacterium]|nr:MAG: hypothetical protein DRH30_01725 [Deltaproteobacteria bacterium]